MVFTRKQQAAQEALFREILHHREVNLEKAIEDARGWGGVHRLGCLPCLHLAAAVGCTPALALLVANGAAVNAFLPVSLDSLVDDMPWLAALSWQQRQALAAPGVTALAVACRVAHAPSVEALLQLGADPNFVGPVLPQRRKPCTPLGCAALVAGEVEGVAAAATRRVVAALLAAGADPLATTVRHQCSALRCACGSAQLGNGALEVMLAHLEQRRVAGHLALPSGDAAADLMVAAARRRCRRLFVVAHEYVVAACGLRLRQQGAAAAAARAAAEERRAARRCSSSSTDSSNDDEGGGGRSSAAQASCTASAPGVLAGLLTEAAAQPPPPPRAPAWQPTTVQLFETLRSAALGGCPAILRCILASPLPFSLAGADAQGHGLLALCAVHADSDLPFAVLHAAGARLSLARLLFLLERRVPPERLSALLALQRPAVSQQAVWLQAGGVRCWACPIHRLLRVWETGRQPSERAAMATLEALLAAGYRPTVWRNLPHAVMPGQAGKGPFYLWNVACYPDRRLRLAAQGGSWTTEVHRIWPEAFKAAVRTLLLANHKRGAPLGGGRPASRAQRAARRRGDVVPAGASLATLPRELLPHIFSAAAWPMSAWL